MLESCEVEETVVTAVFGGFCVVVSVVGGDITVDCTTDSGTCGCLELVSVSEMMQFYCGHF